MSMTPRVGPGRRPALRRRRRATSRSRIPNRPRSSQRRNQPHTVRHGGQPAGRARQGPPARGCHATAPTTRRTGVARPLRGGSARSNQAAISSAAHAATSPFRPGSCRARRTSVHIPSSAPIPDDHAPPSETPRSGGNRMPIRTQTDGVIGAPDRGGGCSTRDGGTWSVGIGHEHRGGATVKHFAGLDVSLEETVICVVDEAGGIVREARLPSEPEALVAFFRGLGLVMDRIGLEACSLAAWLHEGLTAAGLPAVCLETRRAKAAMGAMPNKTDRNDARGIAQIVRTGWYRAVHVKSPACRSWRALLAARQLVLNKVRDVENGLRALLREAGLKLGTPARKELAVRVRELTAADPVLSALAE